MGKSAVRVTDGPEELRVVAFLTIPNFTLRSNYAACTSGQSATIEVRMGLATKLPALLVKKHAVHAYFAKRMSIIIVVKKGNLTMEKCIKFSLYTAILVCQLSAAAKAEKDNDFFRLKGSLLIGL
jgi:hypothetical protein